MKMAATTRLFLLIFGVLMTSGAGQVAAETALSGDNPATYRGPDREQRLLEGARKEGQVTVYSSMIADQDASDRRREMTDLLEFQAFADSLPRPDEGQDSNEPDNGAVAR